MLQIPNLSGGGGAERFFADFFVHYNNSEKSQFNLYFLSDDFSRLNETGRLLKASNKMLAIRNHRFLLSNRFGFFAAFFKKYIADFLLFLSLRRLIIKNNISLLHIAIYEKRDYRVYWYLDKFMGKNRPTITTTIVNCRIPYLWDEKESKFSNSTSSYWLPLFNNVSLQGIISWYKLFFEFAEKENLLKNDIVKYSIKSRFSSVNVIAEEDWKKKKNLIVYASRLDEQKNPLLFVEAIEKLKEHSLGELLKQWTVEIYGNGPLKKEIEERVSKIKHISISVKEHNKMPEVFKFSKCFVSTQEYENFPSLTMAEALSQGNVIIAQNVGQTDYFVQHNKNGFLIEEKNSSQLAESIISVMKMDSIMFEEMAKESVRLIEEVHTPENFISQMDEFWTNCVNQNHQA